MPIPQHFGHEALDIMPRIQPVQRRYKTKEFDCGHPELNDYLRRFALTNLRDGYGRTYVALGQTPELENVVEGYYTMSANGVPLSLWPEGTRGPSMVPSLHLGRLAVDQRATGKRLGETLLFHAFHRAVMVADLVAVHALEVRAIDDQARGFYERYDFIAYQDDALHLYIPLKTLQQIDFGTWNFDEAPEE